MDNFHFGENLRKIRQTKGISQEFMGMELGMVQSTYSKIESKSEIPDQALVEKICDILNERPKTLLNGIRVHPPQSKTTFKEKILKLFNRWRVQSKTGTSNYYVLIYIKWTRRKKS